MVRDFINPTNRLTEAACTALVPTLSPFPISPTLHSCRRSLKMLAPNLHAASRTRAFTQAFPGSSKVSPQNRLAVKVQAAPKLSGADLLAVAKKAAAVGAEVRFGCMTNIL